MIIERLCNLFQSIIFGLLSWIDIPHIDTSVQESISNYLFLFFGNGQALFNFFVPRNLVTVGLPILLVISGFKYGYYFVMWVLKKIPMLGIE